jgi:hypothetical protein
VSSHTTGVIKGSGPRLGPYTRPLMILDGLTYHYGRDERRTVRLVKRRTIADEWPVLAPHAS